METWLIILIVFIVVNVVLLLAFNYLLIPYILFRILLVRTKPDKWSRQCSNKEDDEQKTMFNEGEKWANQYSDFKKDVKINNDGFNLYGEYIDFGKDKAVIIISGRTEGCVYSYYFAEPYRKAGYNILVIDNRSHGLSEGKYNSLGLKEYKDVLKWGKLLHNEYGMNEIMLHGICIGSATALYALTSPDCPSYFKGLVADGMYVSFRESTINHMIEQKHKPYPYINVLMWYFKKFTHTDADKNCPLNVMPKLDKPVLFIYSKQDNYSKPDKSQILYDACTNDKKQIAWFDKGAHSRVRINNKEKYDDTILNFLNNNFRGDKDAR